MRSEMQSVCMLLLVPAFLACTEERESPRTDEPSKPTIMKVEIEPQRVGTLGFPLFVTARIKNATEQRLGVPLLDVARGYLGKVHCLVTGEDSETWEIGVRSMSGLTLQMPSYVFLGSSEEFAFTFDMAQLGAMSSPPFRAGTYSVRIVVSLHSASPKTTAESVSASIRLREPTELELAFLKGIGVEEVGKSWFPRLAKEEADFEIPGELSQDCQCSARVLRLVRDCSSGVPLKAQLPEIGKFEEFYGGGSLLAARLLAEKVVVHKWENPNLREYVKRLVGKYPHLASVPSEVDLFLRNAEKPMLAALIANRAAYLEYRKRQQEKQNH